MARRGRTPTGNTPHRTVRIPDTVWHTAMAIAAKRGEKITAVIERALRNYVARHRHLIEDDDTPPQSG